MYLEWGSIACDPTGRQLWIAYQQLGEVHAHTSEGTLLWIARLEGFHSPGLFEGPGSVRFDRNGRSQAIELISNVTYLPPDLVLVDVESRAHLGDTEIARRFYILDSNTGEGLGVVDGYGVIGGGYDRVVLYREDPFPQFSVVVLRKTK